ncbi:MAG TPA: hypothetical protein ENO03_03345 [Candidatus Aminicenantes bacterium]|nr:hypothetical protein [Candidatus Aminicenantes bacterium]
MKELTKADIQRIVSAEIEKRGLSRLASMFAREHNVPRGTHKADAVAEAASIDADTLDGLDASAFALVGHKHPEYLSGSYDAEYKSLCVSTE